MQEADDDDLLPGTYPVGTLSRDSVDDSIEDLYVYIKAVGRTYGDSIVLRWAVESYPEWDRLNRTGYDVLRHTEGEGEFLLDTSPPSVVAIPTPSTRWPILPWVPSMAKAT